MHTFFQNNKNIFSITFTTLIAIFALTSLNATTSFNKNLSESDRAKINSGEVVIVNTGNTKKICLDSDNKAAIKLIETMMELKPAYFAEVIQVKPYRGNEDLVERLKQELLNVEGYAGIPYWSVRHERYYDLYDWAKVISKSENAGNVQMKADVYMSPFAEVGMDITIEQTGSSLFYMLTNTTKMYYEEKFKVTNPGGMKSGIAVFRDGDNWILYGAGGVDALSVFFLRDRVETSFINRIKSFTAYFIQKVGK